MQKGFVNQRKEMRAAKPMWFGTMVYEVTYCMLVSVGCAQSTAGCWRIGHSTLIEGYRAVWNNVYSTQLGLGESLWHIAKK